MNLTALSRTQTSQPTAASQPTPQEPRVAQAPDAILGAWIEKLQFIALQQHPQVRDLLTNVAKGQVFADNEAAAQGAFNVLLQHEEFEVFAEVFEAYNRLQTDKLTDQNTGVSSFVSTLTLQLPKQWTPERTSPETMLDVFERIHVDKLVVVAPDALSPVPASMGPCIQALLKSGKTTALIVHGLLRPGFLGGTTFANSALRSIELDGDAPPEVLRLAFRDLMGSLVTCSTLKHLTLKHAAFAQFHPYIGKFESSLETIRVSGKAPRADDTEDVAVETEHLGMLVHTIAAISTVSVLELKVAIKGPDLIADHVIASLNGHPALTSLNIRELGKDSTRIDATRFASELIHLSNSCPKLEHLVHEFGKSREAAMPSDGSAVPEDEPMPPLELGTQQDSEPAAVASRWPTNAPAA